MIDARPVELAALYAAGGYLLGSVPVAWLLTWAITGRDLRTLGSGNVGVMNTALSVNRWAGLVVLLTEIAKGVLAVAIPALGGAGEVAIGCCALGAFIGTRWPVWLRFHGGRGNTCAASSIVLVAPIAVPIVAVLWFSARWLGANNVLATRLLAAGLPPAMLVATWSWWWLAVGAAYSLLFLTTHHAATDDHMLIRQQFPSFWAFVTAPPRRDEVGRSDR